MDQRQIGECGRQARVLYDGTVQATSPAILSTDE
jgi:hypothetical protein